MIPQPTPGLNRILAALTAEEYERLHPGLEHAHLTQGEVLYEPGEPPEYVTFPTTSIVSLVYITEDGATVEVAMIGNRGMVGSALFLGGDSVPYRAVVQAAGGAYRLRARALRDEFARGGRLQRLLLRYTQALMTQSAQSAACNRLHRLEQRFCRWLLLARDRVISDELELTQEFIAEMLGVRREAVTVAAGQLQDAGLISYSRGHITVLDRQGLEARACECYRIVHGEYERLVR